MLMLMMAGKDLMAIAHESELGIDQVSYMLIHLESLGYIERMGTECGTTCGPCPNSRGGSCGSLKGTYFRITEKGIRRLENQRTRT